jgi:hypothetical protein
MVSEIMLRLKESLPADVLKIMGKILSNAKSKFLKRINLALEMSSDQVKDLFRYFLLEELQSMNLDDSIIDSVEDIMHLCNVPP